MSMSILHRPKSDVDDQTDEPGFLANAVSSDANHIDFQYRSLDDHCLADHADWPEDEGVPDPLSRYYQRHANDLFLDGWRLVPVQAINRPDVQVVVTAPNIEVPR